MPGEMDQTPETEKVLEQWFRELEAYDSQNYRHIPGSQPGELLKETESKLISARSSAVPRLIEILHKRQKPSFTSACAVLGEIGDPEAIKPLVEYLEDKKLGEDCKNALVKFGPVSVPEIIKAVETRISHPVEESGGFISRTHFALSALGKIKCHESAAFLNKLLDDYMEAMPSEDFDPFGHDWPYCNVDFFHLLDCMVKQQDKSSIPHIKKAGERFPHDYTEYLICQMAAGRIENGSVEGYLPLEALNLAIPDEDPVEDLLSNGMGEDIPMGDDFNMEDFFDK